MRNRYQHHDLEERGGDCLQVDRRMGFCNSGGSEVKADLEAAASGIAAISERERLGLYMGMSMQ